MEAGQRIPRHARGDVKERAVMLYLVHHGEAVLPDVDPQRPLSTTGRQSVEQLAAEAAVRGIRPQVVWHSGKLRAKQTAEIFWRVCNPLADFQATRDLQPDDPAIWMRDRLRYEPRDLLLAGHFPHLPRLLVMLRADAVTVEFPAHGIVALRTEDEGNRWEEVWRMASPR
jgi:phosphohistidine phosphatase